MGHALGNVLPLLDLDMTGSLRGIADLRMDLQETLVEHGMPLDDWWAETFRDTADQINGKPPL
jgi:hypothetical protein